MKDCIYDAVKKQNKNLEIYIKRFNIEITEDDIHDFRVSVKRLRAYRYFHRILNYFNIKIGDNLEMAYLAAGRLRDTTNKMIYLKSIEAEKELVDSDLLKLESMKDVYLHEFQSILINDPFILKPISDSSKTISTNNIDIVHSELTLIFNVIMANLKEILQRNNLDINLHDVRKLYKKLSYLFELVSENESSIQSENDQKISVGMEKRLGTWHDLHVLKLEAENFKSLTLANLENLEIECTVHSRDDLIQFANSQMEQYRLVSTSKI